MKPDVYAKAIFELTSSGSDASGVIDGMMKSLRRRGTLGLLPKILSIYKKLVKQSASKASVLTVAKDGDADSFKRDKKVGDDVRVVVDEDIIGGYRLESDGKLIDNSFKTQLLQVYRKAIKV